MLQLLTKYMKYLPRTTSRSKIQYLFVMHKNCIQSNLITSLDLLSTHYRMIPTTYCVPFVKSKWGNYSDLWTLYSFCWSEKTIYDVWPTSWLTILPPTLAFKKWCLRAYRAVWLHIKLKKHQNKFNIGVLSLFRGHSTTTWTEIWHSLPPPLSILST